MSKFLSAVASKQFDGEVKHAFQMTGVLSDTVTMRTGVVGDTYNFRKMGKGLATQRTAPSSDSIPMDISHSLIPVTLQDWDADDFTDIFNSVEVNFDETQELGFTIASALGRRKDQTIIDAMVNAGAYAGTVTTAIGGADTNLNVDKLRKAKRYLDEKGVPASDRHIAVSAANMEALLGETQATSSDYNTVKALVQGDIDTFVGFKFHMIEDRDEGGLPVAAGDVRSCFAWHKTAVGCAIGKDVTSGADWVPLKKSWLAHGEFKGNSVARDTDGIVKILCDET